MAKNNDMYYPSFRGRACEIRNAEKRLIRKFMMKTDVINAQISGAGDDAMIAITCKDGKTYLYTSSGRLIRS